MIATAVSNEDILDILQDLMKMTGDGFARLEGRMDGMEGRMDGIEGRIDGLDERMGRVEHRLQTVEQAQSQQGRDITEIKDTVRRLENEQKAQTNDIAEILDRIIALERKAVLDEVERKEAALKLQAVVEWAKLAAKQLDISLKLS